MQLEGVRCSIDGLDMDVGSVTFLSGDGREYYLHQQ